jgi:hypothetical protein
MAIANPAHPNMGYAGIFMDRGEYAMSDPNAYVDPPNPGATPNYEPVNPDGTFRFITENDRAIIKAQHAADLIIWSNHEVVHRILKEALDKAVPSDYKPTLTIGQRGFGNRTVRDIFADLYARYGTVTANDIQNLNLNLYTEWNPADPIESHLLNIETQQVFATKARRPFYTYQLIEASLAIITKTRHFKEELKEFTRLHPDTTLIQWHVYKDFWIRKYADYERDRTNMQTLGYHGANNAEDDNNSLASLTEAFSSLQSQRTQQDMALQSLLQEVSTLRQMVSNQHAANAYQPSIPSNIQFPPAPPAPPAPPTYYQPPPPPTQHPPPPPPPPAMMNAAPATPYNMPPAPQVPPATQQYVAPQQQTSYNNQYSGGRGRGRNGGRGGRNSGNRSNPPHPIKRYNNWFYCSTCGFDSPHESPNCTRHNNNGRHIPHLTRDMKIADMHLPLEQQQYRSASHTGHHKRFLPSQAAANGYPQYQRDF